MNTTSRFHLLLLGSSAVCMAITSTTFSVLGAVNLFVGIHVLAGIAAASLELGKFSAAAHLHSHWNLLNWFSRFYLSLALGLLVAISSGEIFFQLSSGFAESSAEMVGATAMLDEWRFERNNAADQLRSENDRIDKIGSPYLQRVAKTAAEVKLGQLETQIKDLNSKIGNGITTSTTARLNSGPITLFATTLGCTISTTQAVVVALFTSVFDPLAVILVMIFSSALESRKEGGIAKRQSGHRRNAHPTKSPKRRRARKESVLSPTEPSNPMEGRLTPTV